MGIYVVSVCLLHCEECYNEHGSGDSGLDIGMRHLKEFTCSTCASPPPFRLQGVGGTGAWLSGLIWD